MDRLIFLLPSLLGMIVGLSLGLTGGGGAIFAVPLLVYGLHVPPREAVGISLITVGCTALVGFIQRARKGMVEFPTGFLFASAGMIGAPFGAWVGARISERVLLSSFTLLMLVIAIRMWRTANAVKGRLLLVVDENAGPTCRRDPEGKLRLTSQCAMLLAGVALCAGVLSGLFGVGGGFIIVPALVFFSGMGMQRAIGTSLLVITLVSVSGTASHLVAGKDLTFATAGLFIAWSIAGLFAGSWLAQRLAGPTLQKVFAVAIVGLASYMVFRTMRK